MQETLIGYLLGALEAEEMADVEARIAASAEVRRQLEILRFALTPLGKNTHLDTPPQGLGIRTCGLLREIRLTQPPPSQEE